MAQLGQAGCTQRVQHSRCDVEAVRLGARPPALARRALLANNLPDGREQQSVLEGGSSNECWMEGAAMSVRWEGAAMSVRWEGVK